MVGGFRACVVVVPCRFFPSFIRPSLASVWAFLWVRPCVFCAKLVSFGRSHVRAVHALFVRSRFRVVFCFARLGYLVSVCRAVVAVMGFSFAFGRCLNCFALGVRLSFPSMFFGCLEIFGLLFFLRLIVFVCLGTALAIAPRLASLLWGGCGVFRVCLLCRGSCFVSGGALLHGLFFEAGVRVGRGVRKGGGLLCRVFDSAFLRLVSFACILGQLCGFA
ncbi:hypothetical protein SAMN04488032_103243 [Pacificibacter marinus]|nr:hypothetical protein SAMN04488032_103243 [Pacificibacter marinus]